MRSIGLVIGNGLNISLRQAYPIELSEWDTRRPLSWRAAIDACKGDFYQLPDRSEFPNDYDFMAAELRNEPPSSYNQSRRLGICNRLLAGFAAYQHVIDQLSFDRWGWIDWFRKHIDRLQFIVSFNYDLLVERALSELGFPYSRVGVREETDGLPIFKPHGSLDYGWPEWLVKEAMDYYRTTTVRPIILQNSSYERIAPEHFGKGMISVSLVLPTESNFVSDFQTIRKGWKLVHDRIKRVSDLVLIGISYWSVDRPELNQILNDMPSNSIVHIANPTLPSDLLDYLSHVGRRWQQMPLPQFTTDGRSTLTCND